MLKLLQTPVVLVLGALALSAFGQAQTPGQPAQRKPASRAAQNLKPPQPVPDYIIYVIFFHSVESLDNRGHSAYVAGDKRRSEMYHTFIKWEARLTERENEVLKGIAAECLKQADAIESAWRAAHPGLRPPLDEATAADLKVVKDRYAQVILGYVEQLKTAFGPKRFPVLDRYVRYKHRNIQVFDDEGTQK
jgi:hypothetical protein